MRHRHLTLEQYELAVEEDPSAAARCRRRAEKCRTCAAALAQEPLAPLLATWVPPAAIDRPADWDAALRRAIAPSLQRQQRGRLGARRLVAAAVIVAGLLLLAAVPAAASTDPHSVLFPVRGAEEEVRWQLTPEPDRAELEADLASAYLWQARTSAARHDSPSYEAAMQRFFLWAGRLQTDLRRAAPGQRSRARDSVSVGLSLVSPLTASGPDPAAACRARSIIDDVESDEGDGPPRGRHRGPDACGRNTSGRNASGEDAGRGRSGGQ